MDVAGYLQKISNVVNEVVNPVTAHREDGTPFTKGMDPATARLRLKETAQELGIQPAPGTRGTLQDHTAFVRRELVVKTNVELAQGAGHFIEANNESVVEAFPCQELVRFEGREKERDWGQRWIEAAHYSGDDDATRVYNETGRMVARKDSPIWDALGDTDLFDDALGNPFPPFAFNSGMWVIDVSFEDARALRLVNDKTKVEPQTLEFSPGFEVSDSITDSGLREAVGSELS